VFKSPIPLDQITSDFQVKRSNEYGETLVLVIPNHIGCTWTQDNLIFRSSMWTEDGYLVSPSFKKFFNWNEKDNLVPPPDSLLDCTVVEKIDGSTLIVSPFKGQTIIRTRGTFNVNIFDNAPEIEFLKKRYPTAFEFNADTQTRLFEWYSPSNKIVLNMGPDPRLFLTGCIFHDSYRMLDQRALDNMAIQLGVERPGSYTFDSIEDLLEKVKVLKDKEGVCVYYNHGQFIKKVKATTYLTIHAFKSELSINNLLDVYIDAGRPDYNDFFRYIEQTFDYECAVVATGSISILADAKKEVDKIVEHMHKFASSVRELPRKEAALKIISAYGKTSRSGFVFSILDGHGVDNDAYKKLFHQVIPK
jgi:hypothetical protein